MEKVKIDLTEQYMELANACAVQRNKEISKENIRKDIELLLDVLGNHTTSSGYSETTSYDFVVSDENVRGIITNKLLDKIKKL